MCNSNGKQINTSNQFTLKDIFVFRSTNYCPTRADEEGGKVLDVSLLICKSIHADHQRQYSLNLGNGVYYFLWHYYAIIYYYS